MEGLKEKERIVFCISEHIKSLVVEWGTHPWDINNGECEDFASCLSVKLTDAKITHSYEYVGSDEDLPGHCWLVIPSGLHFDAEEPYGVDDQSKLPIFLRWSLQKEQDQARLDRAQRRIK